MYHLPIELQIEILKFSDIETCVNHEYYKNLDNKTDIYLLNYAIKNGNYKLTQILLNKGYKFRGNSLEYAIFSRNLDIVKYVLKNIDRSLLYSSVGYIQCAEINNLCEIEDYLIRNI